MKHSRLSILTISCLLSLLLFCGCGSSAYGSSANSAGTGTANESTSAPSGDMASSDSGSTAEPDKASSSTLATGDSSEVSSKGSRDNTPVCLVPEASGTEVNGNELVTIDSSHSSEGYIMVHYTGSNDLAKCQIICPNTITYTYRLSKDYDVLPLTPDSGLYRITIYENISGTQYSTAFSVDINVTIENEFGPYLYPNQYVNFNSEKKAVALAAELAEPCNSDLDVVAAVYNYVISNITYDMELAATIQAGYLPEIDRTLETKKGICQDYASLMASMLRSQGIPTHFEVGYAGQAYHAWISTYISDVGWVSGIVEFDGVNWSMMDPTMAANNNEKDLKEFIGDGSNYVTKYIY